MIQLALPGKIQALSFICILAYTSNRVSVCAASVVLFESKGGPWLYHPFLLAVYGTLYFCFIIVFGLQLQHWDAEIAGHCYSTLNITFSLALHPKADMVYLGLTSLYWCVTIWYTTRAALSNLALIVDNHSIKSPVDQAQHDWNWKIHLLSSLIRSLTDLPPWFIQPDPRASVVLIATMQYPLHCYMLLALRNSNQSYLAGESENSWGFGQVVALVLRGSTILKCIQALIGILSV